MPFGNSKGKELEIERSTRVPIQEERRAGRELDVRVPVSQARWAALSIALLVVSFLFAAFAFGPAVFWAVTFIVGATTYIWLLIQARRWEEGIVPIDVLTGFLLTLLVGFVAWSLWRVLSLIAPGWDLPAWAVKVQAWVAILSLVFSVSFFLHIELAFSQEMAYRSPFFEQYIFKAIGEILEFRGKRPRPKRQPVAIYDRGRRVGDDDGRKPPGNGRAVAEEWLGEIVGGDDDLRDALDMLEFLVRGQRWEDGDGPIKYSRRRWEGLQLSSGTVVTQYMVKGWVATLGEMGILENTGNGLDLAPGVSLAQALDHVSIELDVSPHPSDLREWAGQGTVTGPSRTGPDIPGQKGLFLSPAVGPGARRAQGSDEESDDAPNGQP